MPDRYRKKPVEIEAVCYGPYSMPTAEMHAFLEPANWGVSEDGIIIKTLEGEMLASVGDWIIKGVKGEFYPCKPDIFAATYEPASLASLPSDDEVGRVISEWQKAMEGVTPGPWGWFGSTRSYVYLATQKFGRRFIMGFKRKGLHGAEPTFQVNSVMVPASDLAIYEVNRNATDAKDPSVYRHDIVGFRSADATWIARCSPDSIGSLLALLQSQAAALAAERARAERAEAALAEANRALEPFAAEADEWPWKFGDDQQVSCRPGPPHDEDEVAKFTVGHLRAARRAHSKDGGEHV